MFSLNALDNVSLQTLFERVVNMWLLPRLSGYLKGSDLFLAKRDVMK